MISILPNTKQNLSSAYLTPDPKHIWIDGERVVIYTGADIPPTPAPEPVMISESVAIAAIKAANSKLSDAQVVTLLDGAKELTATEVVAVK